VRLSCYFKFSFLDSHDRLAERPTPSPYLRVSDKIEAVCNALNARPMQTCPVF